MSTGVRAGLVFVIEKNAGWVFGSALKALDHKSGVTLQVAASHLAGPVAMLDPVPAQDDVAGIVVLALAPSGSPQETWTAGRHLFEYLSVRTQLDEWCLVDDRGLDDATVAHAFFHLALGFESCRPPRSPYKADPRPELRLLPGKALPETIAREYEALKESIHFARECIVAPPNDLFPASYAQKIKERFSGIDGVTVELFDETRLRALQMNCVCAVGQGSDKPPVMAVIKLVKNGQTPTVALVGKGVTYDTGGLSLKPAQSMMGMHRDMTGAAVVVGAIESLARDPNGASAYAVVGLVENMPDGKSYRPNDVLRAASGKTVEVLNTDAEGRLILADLLYYAQKTLGCTEVIDVATLTGAVVQALGTKYTAVFGNNSELVAQVCAVGVEVGEPVHHLPYEPFRQELVSKHADIKNIAEPGVGGGASVGAAFLAEFIEDGTRWAHLDIAAVGEKPPLTRGYGIKMLWKLLKNRAQRARR